MNEPAPNPRESIGQNHIKIRCVVFTCISGNANTGSIFIICPDLDYLAKLLTKRPTDRHCSDIVLRIHNMNYVFLERVCITY